MKTIMPICSTPAIKSLGFYAFPLSIIQTKEKQYTPWFYNEFTQLQATVPTNDDFVIDFYFKQEDCIHNYQPLVSHKMHLADLVMEDVVSLYRLMIQNHYYVYTFVDKWFLSAYHLKDHWWHDLMLYGFDDEEQIFWAEGYVDNYIRTFPIPYAEMKVACQNGTSLAALGHYAVFYRLKDVDIPTDLNKLRTHLYDYMRSNNTQWRENSIAPKARNSKWGMACYDPIRNYCRSYREGDRIVRMASIYPILEHKAHMHRRLRYLAECGHMEYTDELDQQMQVLVAKANALINRFVRAHQKHALGMDVEKEIRASEDLVNELQTRETLCLNQYMDRNRKIFNL